MGGNLVNSEAHMDLARALHADERLVVVSSERARTYRLTLRRDGTAQVTMPRRGTEQEARAFAEQHRDWLARARARQARRPKPTEYWSVGTPVLWRGEMTEIRVALADERPRVCLAADVFPVPALDGDLRVVLEA
jgi:predicted metal-dependent hydrolase